MNIFDQMHLEHFDALYGLPTNPAVIQRIAEMAGISIEEVKAHFNIEHVGNVYGAAHATTAVPIIERALYQQGAQSLTLKISREPGEENHHLQIKVLEVCHAPIGSADEN
jgi:hypothetical protein